MVGEVLEDFVWDVFDKNPVDLEVSNPLVRVAPLYLFLVFILCIRQHLCNSAELSALVQTEEQVDWVASVLNRVVIHLVKSVVTILGAGPNLVCQRLNQFTHGFLP
jgi:hypothetical protein